MSFELLVAAPDLTEDLTPAWIAALADYGLECEFYPGFSLLNWRGGHLPASLRITRLDAFPAANRYGPMPILAGFELDISEFRPVGLRRMVPRRLSRFPAVGSRVAFRTATGRSVADLRLQCMAAATLTSITGGLYSDPQQGVVLGPADAISAAIREANGFEENPVTPDDWTLTVFTSWQAFDSESGGA